MTTDPYYKLADTIKKTTDELLASEAGKIASTEAQLFIPSAQYYGFLKILHKRNIRQLMRDTVTPLEDTPFNRYLCDKFGKIYKFLTGKTFLLYPKMSKELTDTYIQGLKDIENKVFHGFTGMPTIRVDDGE